MHAIEFTIASVGDNLLNHLMKLKDTLNGFQSPFPNYLHLSGMF